MKKRKFIPASITAEKLSYAFNLGNLRKREAEKVFKCIEVYKDYEDFKLNCGWDEDTEIPSEKELIESKACAYISSYFVYFSWILWGTDFRESDFYGRNS